MVVFLPVLSSFPSTSPAWISRSQRARISGSEASFPRGLSLGLAIETDGRGYSARLLFKTNPTRSFQTILSPEGREAGSMISRLYHLYPKLKFGLEVRTLSIIAVSSRAFSGIEPARFMDSVGSLDKS